MRFPSSWTNAPAETLPIEASQIQFLPCCFVAGQVNLKAMVEHKSIDAIGPECELQLDRVPPKRLHSNVLDANVEQRSIQKAPRRQRLR